jgi:hypothetical protein
MLVGTNGMMTLRKLRKIPTVRGRAPLLRIKTFKGLKRQKFMPLRYGTYLWLTAWSKCYPILEMLSFCFGMWSERLMESSNIRPMVGNGNISTLTIRRTSLMIQGIWGLVLEPMEWILSERWWTHTLHDQLLYAYTIFLHGCATSKNISYWQPSYMVLNNMTLTYMFFGTINRIHVEDLEI